MLMKNTENKYLLKCRNKPRAAVILSNYNMPEASDKIAEWFLNNVSDEDYDLYLVDNGSDLVKPSKYTTVFAPENGQTMGGWVTGLAASDKIARARGERYFSYIFTITSTTIPDQHRNLFYTLHDDLYNDEWLVGISPALTDESTTAWGHMKQRTVGGPYRATWMIDNIFAMYRACWFNKMGRFDPRFTYAWGPDLEMGYIARQVGKGIGINDNVVVHKETDIGYKMDRMNMSAQDRRSLARASMENVMIEKYGPDWEWKMRNELVTDDLK